MKRFSRIALAIAAAFLCAPKAHAIQFSLPYVVQQSTTITNAPLVISTAGFPSTNYMNCLQHLTAETNIVNAQLLVLSSTSTLTPATTNYAVVLSSGLPFDTQWGNLGAFCGPPNNIVTLSITAGTFTISVERFVTQGWSP